MGGAYTSALNSISKFVNVLYSLTSPPGVVINKRLKPNEIEMTMYTFSYSCFARLSVLSCIGCYVCNK